LSSAVELCEWLVDQGTLVRAHDPAVKTLPQDLAERITLVDSARAAVDGASALVVSTPWPDYRQVAAAGVAARMANRLVLDANRFFGATLGADPSMRHLSVGKASA
jgi:UDPglucose 6-dehydrogenase